jgi:hypothetical protein
MLYWPRQAVYLASHCSSSVKESAPAKAATASNTNTLVNRFMSFLPKPFSANPRQKYETYYSHQGKIAQERTGKK